MRSLGAYAVDRRPLAVPAFRRLWLASVVAAVGGSFGAVAVPAQVFAVGGSSAAVGASGGVSLVALVVGALGAGVAADLRDRRSVLLAAHGGLAAACLGLWAQAALGVDSVAVLLVLVGCQGLALGAIMTTMGAVLPRLVPPELLPAANGLASLVRYAGAVIGPVAAGALIPVVGWSTLYLLDALAVGAVIGAVLRLPPLPPQPPPPPVPPPDAPRHPPPPRHRFTPAALFAGFRHLARSPLLRAVLALDLAAMVFGMPVALFPELAERGFGGAPGGGPALGLLYAAYPAGVFAAGLVSGTFTRARRHGALMAGAAAVWGASVVVLGLAGRLWLALAALALGGAVNFVLSTVRNAMTQALTDDAVRGRIQGALIVVTMGGPQIATVLHGAAGALAGPRPAIVVGGVLTIAAAAALVWAVPELRRYDAAAQQSVTRPPE